LCSVILASSCSTSNWTNSS